MTGRCQVRDVVGLYLDPPQGEVVVSVDAKSGTADLYAAMDIRTGKIISSLSSTTLPRTCRKHWNNDSAPITWTATAEEIINKVRTITSHMEALHARHRDHRCTPPSSVK
ncbi:MAG: hypothetical protein LC775_11800 [Acidobacteria bacterium]|nr:hypothetical protein [Acidobacteriota bacterium]